MNDLTRAIVSIFSTYKSCIPEPIYEFGSMQVKGQEGSADLRKYFPGTNFVGCDIREGLGVDRIENVESINLPDDSIGTCLCLNTLEHVQNPEQAIKEMIRVTSGTLLIAVPFKFPVHEFPSDYWRMTPQCMGYLLTKYAKPGSIMFLFGYGTNLEPETVLGMLIRNNPSGLTNMYNTLGRLCTEYNKRAVKIDKMKKYLPGNLVGFLSQHFIKLSLQVDLAD